MFKIKNLNLISKFSNLSLSSSNRRNFLIINNYEGRFYSVNSKLSSGSSQTIPPPPKRSSNVFALFVRDCFKRMPSNMPVKERFALAGQEWRQMSPEQKEHYQKMSMEEFVKYKAAMNNYLGALSKDEMIQYKKMKKDQMKTRNRQRIKSKLRELNYPKRSLSAYIFFIRSKLKQEYPEGNYPPVRTQEHLQLMKAWSQQWHQMTLEQRQPYNEMAEADRKRYFEELEQWKHELAKPENEEKFRQLERLSKKMEVANLPTDRAKLRIKRQRRVAAKIIRKRLMKKAAAELKAEKKAKMQKKKELPIEGKKVTNKSSKKKSTSQKNESLI